MLTVEVNFSTIICRIFLNRFMLDVNQCICFYCSPFCVRLQQAIIICLYNFANNVLLLSFTIQVAMANVVFQRLMMNLKNSARRQLSRISSAPAGKASAARRRGLFLTDEISVVAL